MKCYKEFLPTRSSIISTEKEVSPEVKKFIEEYSKNFFYGEFEVDDNILKAIDKTFNSYFKNKSSNNIFKKLISCIQ